jgi:hypothetical protein
MAVPRELSIGANAQRTVRFFVALGLLIYEAVIYQGAARWHLLLLYGTMMGLPIAELGDQLRRREQRTEAGGDDA